MSYFQVRAVFRRSSAVARGPGGERKQTFWGLVTTISDYTVLLECYQGGTYLTVPFLLLGWYLCVIGVLRWRCLSVALAILEGYFGGT